MLKIIDNAIPDDVRRDLLYDKQYTAFPRQQYEWWDIKYFDFPRTAIHQALHSIWKDHIDFEEFKDGGIEWWISKDNVVNGESPFPTHTGFVLPSYVLSCYVFRSFKYRCRISKFPSKS